MKTTIVLGCLILAILSATATAMELQSMSTDGNNIILTSKSPSVSATMVCHIQELKYAHRNTTRGIIFWEKFKANFDHNKQCTLATDLSKAKSNTWYVISVILQSSGVKYQLKCQIENGNFIELKPL